MDGAILAEIKKQSKQAVVSSNSRTSQLGFSHPKNTSRGEVMRAQSLTPKIQDKHCFNLLCSASAAAILFTCATPMSAHAEDSTATPSVQATVQATQIETVVVSARRREENSQDVPVSLTAYSRDDIKWQNATDVARLVQSVPNVEVGAGSRGSSDAVITIRGLATADTSPVFDPSVGIYINGEYLGRTEGALTDVVDLDNVQVLRGPQGTLFGRNSIGGAILINTKRPTDEYQAEVSATYGNLNQRGGYGIVNIPLTADGSWAVRGVVQQMDRNGYGKNVFTGARNLDDANNSLWRVSLLGHPADNVELYVQYDGLESHSNGAARTPIGSPAGVLFAYNTAVALGIVSNINSLPAPGSLKANETVGNFTGTGESTRVNNLLGSLRWDASQNFSLSLDASYRKLAVQSRIDQDGTPAPIADASMPNHQQQRTVEFKANGNLFDGRLIWVAGASWFNEEAAIDVLTNPTFSFTRSDSISNVQNSSVAGFAHASFDVTDRLSVAGGIRYTSDHRQIQTAAYHGAADTLAGCVVSPAIRVDPQTCLATGAVDFDYISWEATADYKIEDGVRLYARASKGDKSGGFNASVQTGFLNPFNPESLTQFETGVKSEWLDNRLVVNVSAYYSIYDDLQRQVIRIIGGAPSVWASNAGSADISGGELEVVALPLDNLTLRGSFGYTYAKYNTWNFVDPVTHAVEDLSHNKFDLVPRYTYSLSANYVVPLETGSLGFQIDWNAKDSYQLSPENRTDFVQGSYGLLNARVAFTTEDTRWEMAIFGTNLADTTYQVFGSVYPVPGGLLVPVTGAPRMFGATVTYRYN